MSLSVDVEGEIDYVDHYGTSSYNVIRFGQQRSTTIQISQISAYCRIAERIRDTYPVDGLRITAHSEIDDDLLVFHLATS